MREVVVVGGSIAALTAVETLRMEDFEGRITVLRACSGTPLAAGCVTLRTRM